MSASFSEECSIKEPGAMTEKRGKMRRPAAVAELLGAILHGQPLELRLREGKIWQVWDNVVGPQIAARARPARFRDGLLTVTVASAPWMQQLTFLKQEIVRKLNARLGEELVRDIYLKAGRVEDPPQPAMPNRKPARPLTEAEQQLIADQTATITDSELRLALQGLLARHLADSEPPSEP